ncbi:MAG TPA: protein kinase [Pseudonocardiaceae bacterium]|nr:protein kinase [Pseudonocardiaceae bacterium]
MFQHRETPRPRDCSSRELSVIDEEQLIAGHYRLLERVGSGSMGIVWRARDERLERVVAVKQLLAQPGLTEEQRQDARRRALREARIAARLHHANAIVVFDVAEHNGDPCLVMEYMESHSLAAVLADRGSLPPEEVAALGSQVASALAAAHRSGIVHRDVKPGNILLNDSGTAKITDFGIARATGDVTVTQSGVFAGTPAYLAPEVARGQEPTPASDVFSFGATLYDAVEGGPPFPERQNQLALLRLVAEGKVQPPRQAGMLTALLMKLLRDDPAARPTMAQASAMLSELTGAKPARPPAFLPSATKPDMAPTTPTAAPPSGPAATQVAASPLRPPPAGTSFATPPPVSVTPARQSQQRPQSFNKKTAGIVSAVVVLLVVAGIVLVVTLSNNGQTGGQAGGTGSGQSTTQQPTTTAPLTSNSAAGSSSQDITDYSGAGTMVINFYSNVAGNPQAAWNLLTAQGQQYYGSEAALASYWAPFAQAMSYKSAHVDSKNADGSVQMSILVSAGGSGQTLVMRVVEQNGQYLIDGNTKLAT